MCHIYKRTGWLIDAALSSRKYQETKMTKTQSLKVKWQTKAFGENKYMTQMS